jgi:glycosyltransferase involved in cell wall biosynthesis
LVSFARGAAPELIAHRKTGFLVRDVEEMVCFIPRIGEIDRRATREYVERNFSVRVMAKKYEKVYNKVITAARGDTSQALLA